MPKCNERAVAKLAPCPSLMRRVIRQGEWFARISMVVCPMTIAGARWRTGRGRERDPVALQLFGRCGCRHGARPVLVPPGVVIGADPFADLEDREHASHVDHAERPLAAEHGNA